MNITVDGNLAIVQAVGHFDRELIYATTTLELREEKAIPEKCICLYCFYPARDKPELMELAVRKSDGGKGGFMMGYKCGTPIVFVAARIPPPDGVDPKDCCEQVDFLQVVSQLHDPPAAGADLNFGSTGEFRVDGKDQNCLFHLDYPNGCGKTADSALVPTNSVLPTNARDLDNRPIPGMSCQVFIDIPGLNLFQQPGEPINRSTFSDLGTRGNLGAPQVVRFAQNFHTAMLCQSRHIRNYTWGHSFTMISQRLEARDDDPKQGDIQVPLYRVTCVDIIQDKEFTDPRNIPTPSVAAAVLKYFTSPNRQGEFRLSEQQIENGLKGLGIFP